jgi:hypothetical protein
MGRKARRGIPPLDRYAVDYAQRATGSGNLRDRRDWPLPPDNHTLPTSRSVDHPRASTRATSRGLSLVTWSPLRAGARDLGRVHQAAVSRFYTSVTVTLVVLFSTVRELDVPLKVPLKPQLVGDPPPITAVVMTPPASRLNVRDSVPPLARHSIPNTGSLVFSSTPAILAFIAVMFGSVPPKLSYLTCHGSDACRTVADPLMQWVPPITDLVMYPVRAPAVLLMVASWKDPSKVTAHPELPEPVVKLIVGNVALTVRLDVLSLFADAVATSALRSRVAPAMARSVLPNFMRDPPEIRVLGVAPATPATHRRS